MKATRIYTAIFAGAVLVSAFFLTVYTWNHSRTLISNVATLQRTDDRLHLQLVDSEKRLSALAAENQRLARERAEVFKLRNEVTMFNQQFRDRIQLPKRLELLKAEFAKNPDARIPGVDSLPEEDWVTAANLPLETEEQIWRAMGHIRKTAVRSLARHAQSAMKEFAARRGGNFPVTVQELAPYLPVQVAQELPNFCDFVLLSSKGEPLLLKAADAIDPKYQWKLEIGPTSYQYRIQTGSL
jgi:hypothetical protein